MKKFIILAALLLGVTGLWAQTNVLISGTSANAAGKRMALYGYNDMLSMTEVLMDETVVDSAGSFALRCYANYPRLVYVEVECYSQSFYVEPGRNYEVWLPEFDWSVDERKNVYLDPEPLPLEFLHLPADELNLRIGRFEALVDSIVSAERVFFDPRYKPDRRRMDTLELKVRSSVFGNKRGEVRDSDDFFGRYVEYTLAEMALNMRFAKRDRLIAKYIADKPVRYYDEQYMRLFLALYAESISHGTRRIAQERLVAWVDECDVRRYADSIGLDPLLRNERVRELAMLEALRESYYDRAYSREAVLHMIERVGKESKFEEHKKLAAALVEKLGGAGSQEQEVKSFVLPDVEHNMVDLDSFRGKWVYMAFVRVNEAASQAEIETMAHFRDSVYARNPNVVFVGISCDREFQKMYHFLKNSRKGHRYNWTWLHYDGDYRLLEHYGVVSYPTFVLLRPDGKPQYELTPTPASGFLLKL